MSLRYLRIFIKVYQEKNITKAAKKLHMAQPAVSRTIQEMEKNYGISLFDRLNHKIYPTRKADELYARAVQIIDSFDVMEEMLRNDNENEMIHIGGTMTIGNFVFPIVVSEFKKRYPSVHVKITISNSADIQKKILDNELDFAIVEENVKVAHLQTEYFYTDNMCLVYSNEHEINNKKSIDLKELVDYPFLLREKGSATRSYLEHIFAVHDLVIEETWESTSTQALINAVSNGIGISILPEKLVQRDLQEGRIKTRKIENKEFMRNTYFIWHEQKVLSEAVNNFKEVCKTIKQEKNI